MRSLPIFAGLLLLAIPASSQTSLVGGTLEGTVADETGGIIQGARITIRDVATHRVRETESDSNGVFRIAQLSPGTYEVAVLQSGFAPYRHQGVDIPLGSTVHLAVVLQSASINTQVTVTAQPPSIDPAQTSVSSAVDKERIEELPVESRNYLNFALLAPGVAASAQQPGRQSLAALPDSGFTFGGLRARSNNIVIDGLDNNDEFVGSSRTELSLETVQEFQVVSGGLSAESGGASGGSIDVITRTGANAIHGDAFLFLQNGALDARNPFESESRAPMLHRYRMGVALGGPIVKDRTFYYAGFEQEHNRGLDDSFISPALASAINRIRPGSVTDNFFPTSRAETEASAKLNHQLTTRNALMVRYAYTNNRESGDAFNTAGWSDPSARGSNFTNDQAAVGALTTVFDPESVGDLRFQVANRRAVLRTNDAAGPGFDIEGLAEFGRPYEGNGSRTESHRQITYSFSRAHGRHLWKAGVTVNHVGEDASIADGFGGTWLFANLTSFALGQPFQFRQAFGNPQADYSVTAYGAYFTDHWSATRKLALDLGLRYDIERLPGNLRDAPHNLSPRIGLAYHVTPRWVLRAGYGIFFDRYVLAALNRVLQKNGVGAFEQVLDGEAAIAAFQSVGSGSLRAPVAGVPPSIYTADSSLGTPYSQQTSAAAERLIAKDLTANLSYLYVRGIALPRTRNIDTLNAYSGFQNIYQLEDSAQSAYQGVTAALNRRMSDEFEFTASYTLSWTRDNASDFTEQPQNPLQLAPEWAFSAQDQRQRFVFNALWELPIGDEEGATQPQPKSLPERIFSHIELAPIFTVETGRPVNPLTGIDNGTDAFPLSMRPAGFGRNAFRGPMFANMDFRVLKYFPFGPTAHLDLVAEAFNLFNRPNVGQVNPIYGLGAAPQAYFLQPLSGTGPRRIQFSLDFEF